MPSGVFFHLRSSSVGSLLSLEVVFFPSIFHFGLICKAQNSNLRKTQQAVAEIFHISRYAYGWLSGWVGVLGFDNHATSWPILQAETFQIFR